MQFDLADQWGLTFALLDSARVWRQRAVHEFVLRDSDHVDASVAYQVHLPLDLVRRYRPGAAVGDEVRLLLPLTVRSKQLLLNVDFVGAGGQPVTLLLRREIAELQAQYLAYLDGQSLSEQPMGGALWVGISAMTTFAWKRELHRVESQARSSGLPTALMRARTRALADYLTNELEVDVDGADVDRWTTRTNDARRLLAEALDEGEDPHSSSDCILLAIPFMPSKPRSVADIDYLVEEYCQAIPVMNPRARQALAEYGRRWEVVIDTVVPIARACTVKLLEQRPWVDAPSPVMTQELAFGDAATTHIEIRAADHGVVLDNPSVTDVLEQHRDLDICDEIRPTADTVAIYASDPDRPYVARIGIRARVRPVQLWILISVLALVVGAVGVAAIVPEDELLVESLALLTFPLTLAGVVVLARDATPLAERLLRRWRVGLTAAIVVLWVLTLVRLLLFAGFWWTQSQ